MVHYGTTLFYDYHEDISSLSVNEIAQLVTEHLYRMNGSPVLSFFKENPHERYKIEQMINIHNNTFHCTLYICDRVREFAEENWEMLENPATKKGYVPVWIWKEDFPEEMRQYVVGEGVI